LEFADLVGENGLVYSFEAQRLVYLQLCANIILNGYSNIYPYNHAVGDRVDIVEVENPNYYSPETINVGNAHVNAYTDNGKNIVEMTLLDDYVR
jgi:FkbM family methyltransferase